MGTGLWIDYISPVVYHMAGRWPWQGRNNTCRLYGSVAQSVEQGTENPRVAGSIPADRTNTCLWLGKQSCGDADKIEERASYPWAGIRIRYAPIA